MREGAVSWRRSSAGCFLSAVLLLVWMAVPAAVVFAADGGSAGGEQEPRITLSVQKRPLGEVLAMISRQSGYAISVSEAWQGHPVDAKIEDEPLHRGLKQVLRSLNHAIVYEEEKQIRIVIYGAAGEGGGTAGPAMPFVPPPPEPVEETPVVVPPPEEETAGRDQPAEETDTGRPAEEVVQESPPEAGEEQGRAGSDAEPAGGQAESEASQGAEAQPAEGAQQ